MRYFLLAILLSGCARVCAPEATRCHGQLAEICGTNGQWTANMDCAKVRPGPWRCAAIPSDMHACVPANDGGGK